MEKISNGFMMQFHEKVKKVAGPLVVGTAMSFTPISIDNNFHFQPTENTVFAGSPIEKLPPVVNIENNLKSLLTSKIVFIDKKGQTQKISNPLKINEAEIQIYLKNKTDKDLRSFQILNNSKGEPALILATNTQSGIYEKNESIQSIKKAFEFLNSADPSIVDKITSQYGVKAISSELANTQMKKNGYNSTSIPEMGIICLNGEQLQDDYILHIFNILNQARYIYLQKYETQEKGNETFAMKKQFDNNPVLDKFIWINNWILKNKSSINKADYNNLLGYTKRTIKNYKKYLDR